MAPLLRLIPLALALAASPAYAASPAAEAEHTRLADDMKRLSGRNAWKGVDDAYRRMETLATEEGVALSYRDHFLGASAARELGDINAVYTRLQRALAVEKTEEVTSWLADLNQNFGQVALRIDAKYPGDRSLAISEMPFDPAQRRVIEAAQLALQNSRVYEGILPLGQYTFGDKSFAVQAGGGAAVAVALEAQSVRGGEGGGLSYAGPRVDLGLSYTMASGEVAGEPTGFGGIGGRLGLGWEIGFSTKVGLVAQVGYHNLVAGADAGSFSDGAPGSDWAVEPVGSSMHLGYGWLAGAVRLGDLRVAAGPVFELGTVSAMGTGNYTGPDGVQMYPSEQQKGTVYGPGAELGLFYGFLSFGKLQSGLGFHAGAFTDSDRWYPWGQLAFTVAPAAYRRDG